MRRPPVHCRGPATRARGQISVDGKLAAIAQAQSEGRIVDSIAPYDVYAFIIALAGTWSPVSGTFTASSDDAPADHERRREELRGLIERALVP